MAEPTASHPIDPKMLGLFSAPSALSEIPSLPEIYHEIGRELADPSASVEKIGSVISKDLSLTARLLRLANSAFFGYSHRIDTISTAIAVIGLKSVRDLVLSTKVIEMFDGIAPELLDMRSFWLHSIGCGIASRVLATYRREQNIEHFFAAGLLHDIGRLVLCLRAPEKMKMIIQQARAERQPLHKIEIKLLGYDHADVGAVLLDTWCLPEAICSSVSHHHRPMLDLHFHSETGILHVADLLTHAMELGHSGINLVPPLSVDAWKKLDLQPKIFHSAIHEIDRQYTEVSRILIEPVK